MKKSLLSGACICICLFATCNLSAQEVEISKKKLKVQRHTIMQQFEPDFVLSAEDRLAIKQKRKEETERKFTMIDTMDISERRRRKLLKDLLRTPYSTRLNKATTIVDTKFDDETIEDNK